MTTELSPSVRGLPFADNQSYLTWEMQRLQQRLNAYLEAKENPAAIEAYHNTLVALESSRRSGILARREAVKAGVPIPFEGIVRRFGLSAHDEEVLMVCLAAHLSATNWHLLICAQGSVLKTYMEIGFVSELTRPSPDLLTAREWCEPGSPLLRGGLIFVEPPPDVTAPMSLLGHAVYTPHYVASAVTGVTGLDERLADFCDVVDPRVGLYDVVMAEDTQLQIDEFVRGFPRVGQALDLGHRPWTLLISGPRRSGKSMLAEGIAQAFRRPMVTLHLDRLERRAESAKLLRLARRNSQFLGAVLHIVQPEALLATDASALGTLIGLINGYPGLIILEPHDADQLPIEFEPLIHFPIEVGRVDLQGRVELWESQLPQNLDLAEDVDLSALSSTFGLTGGQIASAIAWAQQRAETRGESCISQADLRAGASSQVRSKLERYADASKIKLTMRDLVLAEEPKALINELLDACRYRQRVLNEWGFGQRLVTGKGLVALFSGEAGTGKTLCAEIMANELDLRLHIVSIPKVVSKWVGETEKNIRQIFSHARAQNSMLLFDEADSLFTTRVKVEKAQDHFQNMEVNMLLQEIERFEGIVILTTNLETNIDRAFQRRILFKIEFPMPEKEQREAIWRALIPKGTPLAEDVDFRYLGEAYDLSGGQIKNAVIRAAYRACSIGEALGQFRLEEAAGQQSKEAGKLTRRCAVPCTAVQRRAFFDRSPAQ